MAELGRFAGAIVLVGLLAAGVLRGLRPSGGRAVAVLAVAIATAIARATTTVLRRVSPMCDVAAGLFDMILAVIVTPARDALAVGQTVVVPWTDGMTYDGEVVALAGARVRVRFGNGAHWLDSRQVRPITPARGAGMSGATAATAATIVMAASFALALAVDAGILSTPTEASRPGPDHVERVAPSAVAPSAPPPAVVWTVFDTSAIRIQLPGPPREDQHKGGDAAETVTAHSARGGGATIYVVEALDRYARPLSPKDRVDADVSFVLSGVRRALDGGSAPVVSDTRRSVPPLAGRDIVVRLEEGGEQGRVRALVLARSGVTVRVLGVSSDDAAHQVVDQAFGTLQARPTAPATRQSAPAPAPDWASEVVRSYDGDYGYVEPTPDPGAGGTVHVRGYTRKDGTYVAPHTRHAPRR